MLKKIALFIAIIFCASGLSFAQTNKSIDEMYTIANKMYESLNFDTDFTCMITLVIEKPNRPKEALQYKMFRRDKVEQACLIQLAPESEKGIGYLQDKENFWIYDPVSHKFTHSSLKQNMGDSDAKASDVSKKKTFRDYYTITEVSEGKLGAFDVYILSVDAKTPDATYAKERYYIRKDNHLLLKTENLSTTGRLMRTMLMPKYTMVSGRPYPIQIIILNELNKGDKTTQILSDFSTETIPDKVFTKAWIEQIN